MRNAVFFIFVSAFLLCRKENAFLLEIRYIVGVNVALGRFLCDTWPFFDVTLGRFLRLGRDFEEVGRM